MAKMLSIWSTLKQSELQHPDQTKSICVQTQHVAIATPTPFPWCCNNFWLFRKGFPLYFLKCKYGDLCPIEHKSISEFGHCCQLRRLCLHKFIQFISKVFVGVEVKALKLLYNFISTLVNFVLMDLALCTGPCHDGTWLDLLVPLKGKFNATD